MLQTKEPTPEALGTFASSILSFAREHPEDEAAAKYAAMAKDKGEAVLAQLFDEGNPLLTRIFETKQKRVQTGEGGVAQGLYPGITDTLTSLPSKASLFEWLRNSELFCRAMMELCMEIAMDQNMSFDLSSSYQAIAEGRKTRAYGEYVADTRARERLH